MGFEGTLIEVVEIFQKCFWIPYQIGDRMRYLLNTSDQKRGAWHTLLCVPFHFIMRKASIAESSSLKFYQSDRQPTNSWWQNHHYGLCSSQKSKLHLSCSFENFEELKNAKQFLPRKWKRSEVQSITRFVSSLCSSCKTDHGWYSVIIPESHASITIFIIAADWLAVLGVIK